MVSDNRRWVGPDLEDTSFVWSQALASDNRESVSPQEQSIGGPTLGLFVNLPYEIHRQIWQYLYHPPKHAMLSYCVKRQSLTRDRYPEPGENWPAILCISRQIHAEVFETFYRGHPLHVRIHLYGIMDLGYGTPGSEWQLKNFGSRNELFDSRYFSRFRKMKIDVLAPWGWHRRGGCCIDEALDRIRTGIFDLVSELAKCERLPEIEVFVRLEYCSSCFRGQPDTYHPEDNALALAGLIFSLEKPRDAPEVQGALVVPSAILSARERSAANLRELQRVWDEGVAQIGAEEDRRRKAAEVRIRGLYSDVLRDRFI